MTKVSIIGAGMAGLLAGLMFRDDASIVEQSDSLPNNHHALLRFRSNAISAYLNVPFKKVKVIKTSKPWSNPVADALSYSYKSNGDYSIRSSTTAKGEIQDRYIAPDDFINIMLSKQFNSPVFGQKVDSDFIRFGNSDGRKIISTIPMPALMSMLGYRTEEEFRSTSGTVIKVTLPFETDFCGTIYYPDPSFAPYRASMTGNNLLIEISDAYFNKWYDEDNGIGPLFKPLTKQILLDFGLGHVDINSLDIKASKQKYAKILPISEHERKKFIMWATDTYGIYSLGRFATWKPGLLLDDVFEDIQSIQQMLRSTNYEGRKP